MRSTNGNYLLSPVLLSQQKHYSSEELYITKAVHAHKLSATFCSSGDQEGKT